MMRISKWMLLILAVCMIASVGVQADEGKTIAKEKKVEKTLEAKSMTAKVVFADLNEEKVKKVAMLLKENKGIQAIKPNMDEKTMDVTFDSKLNFKEKIMPIITELDPKAQIKDIVKAKAAPSNCGKCPHKTKCTKAENTTKSAVKDTKEEIKEKAAEINTEAKEAKEKVEKK